MVNCGSFSMHATTKIRVKHGLDTYSIFHCLDTYSYFSALCLFSAICPQSARRRHLRCLVVSSSSVASLPTVFMDARWDSDKLAWPNRKERVVQRMLELAHMRYRLSQVNLALCAERE